MSMSKLTPILLAVALAIIALIGFAVVGTNTQTSPSFVTFVTILITGMGTMLASYNASGAKEKSEETSNYVQNGKMDEKIRNAVRHVMNERDDSQTQKGTDG